MAKTLQALDYLDAAGKYPARAVCVLFGGESFLKRQAVGRLREEVLGSDEGDFSLSEFDGRTATLEAVIDELATVAMFGGGKRLVVIDDGDDFVSRNRQYLEGYVAKPKSTGILVLAVQKWPATTRLYKAVAAGGLAIDCGSPSAAKLTRWLGRWAKQGHDFQLAPAAADMLVELVGTELGLLDQELSKLALSAGPGGKISAQAVQQWVGGWRTKTTWEMLDAVLAGDGSGALKQLDRLLLAGEYPTGLLGQISFSLRRLAAATRIVLAAEAAGRRLRLRDALAEAGFKPFLLGKAEHQLRRLGRDRGAALYGWLLEADLALKGGSGLPPRLILERLILRIATPAGDRPSQGDRRQESRAV